MRTSLIMMYESIFHLFRMNLKGQLPKNIRNVKKLYLQLKLDKSVYLVQVEEIYTITVDFFYMRTLNDNFISVNK